MPLNSSKIQRGLIPLGNWQFVQNLWSWKWQTFISKSFRCSYFWFEKISRTSSQLSLWTYSQLAANIKPIGNQEIVSTSPSFYWNPLFMVRGSILTWLLKKNWETLRIQDGGTTTLLVIVSVVCILPFLFTYFT